MVVNAQGEQPRDEALGSGRGQSGQSWIQDLLLHECDVHMRLTLDHWHLFEAAGSTTSAPTCTHPQTSWQLITGNHPEHRATWSEPNPQGRWRPYRYEDLMQRDKVSLDIFWLKDDSLEDSANLEDPDVIAAEIVEDLRGP